MTSNLEVATVVAKELMGWVESDGSWLLIRSGVERIETGFQVASQPHHLPRDGFWNPCRSYSQVLIIASRIGMTVRYAWKGKKILCAIQLSDTKHPKHHFITNAKAELEKTSFGFGGTWNGNRVGIDGLLAHFRFLKAVKV